MAKNTTYAKQKDTVWSPAVKIVALICAICLVAAIVIAIVANTGYFRRNTVVMEVGEHKISQLEYEYYYGTVYSNYASYVSSSNIYTAQCFFEAGKTWHQYFLDEAREQILHNYLLYDAAVAAKFEVTADSKADFDEGLVELDDAAKTMKMDTDEYLSTYVCPNLTRELYVEYASIALLAADYSESYFDSLTYTDEDIDKYYNDPENIKNYQVATYYSFNVIEVDGVSIETRSEEIKAVTSLEGFIDIMKVVRAEDLKKTDSTQSSGSSSSSTDASSNASSDASTGTDANGSGSSDAGTTEDKPKEFDPEDYKTEDAIYKEGDTVSEWLFNQETKNGAVNVLKVTKTSGSTETVTYVAVYLESREKDDSEVASMHHFLVKADAKTDANGKAETDKDGKPVYNFDPAKTEIDKVMKRYEELSKDADTLDKKVEAFKKLFDEFETDDSSQDTFGLYEGFPEGQMVTEINDWFFPEEKEGEEVSRANPGDCKVIQVSSENYGGYHIVLALDYESAVKHSIENTLKNEAFEAYMEDLENKTTVVVHENKLKNVG